MVFMRHIRHRTTPEGPTSLDCPKFSRMADVCRALVLLWNGNSIAEILVLNQYPSCSALRRAFPFIFQFVNVISELSLTPSWVHHRCSCLSFLRIDGGALGGGGGREKRREKLWLVCKES